MNTADKVNVLLNRELLLSRAQAMVNTKTIISVNDKLNDILLCAIISEIYNEFKCSYTVFI